MLTAESAHVFFLFGEDLPMCGDFSSILRTDTKPSSGYCTQSMSAVEIVDREINRLDFLFSNSRYGLSFGVPKVERGQRAFSRMQVLLVREIPNIFGPKDRSYVGLVQ